MCLLISIAPCYVYRSQCFPVQITGWPLELMAYAYLAVSPPSMISQFDEVWFLGLFSVLYDDGFDLGI